MNIPDLMLAASLGFLVFVVSVVVLATDQLERQRLKREAMVRRVIGNDDTRPMWRGLAPVPWKRATWKDGGKPLMWRAR